MHPSKIVNFYVNLIYDLKRLVTPLKSAFPWKFMGNCSPLSEKMFLFVLNPSDMIDNRKRSALIKIIFFSHFRLK